MLSNIPYNTSLLQSAKFQFQFPKLPFLVYMVQNVNIPGVSTSPVTVSSPFANMYRHGDKLEFDLLTISAMMDEDMRVWEESFNWLSALTKPDRFPQYERYNNYDDAVLVANTNANNPNIRFKFTNCHPIAIGPVQFSTGVSPDNIITCDITFRYDQYYIERLPT